MPWTNCPACCFTECTWSSLYPHSEEYSRFGVGFTKEFLFANDGGPALYVPPHLFRAQSKYRFAPELYPFVTTFSPSYAPPEYLSTFWANKPPRDFTHEREWRVPHNLDFSLDDIVFVIVPSADEMRRMQAASDEIQRGLPEDKWLFMNNYEQIERLWPSRLP